MPKSPAPRRWVVDGLEEDTARIEEDGDRIITVPRWLLPADAREGQVLQVTLSATKGTSTVTISVDDAATAAAMQKSASQVEKIAKASKGRDAGGNISL